MRKFALLFVLVIVGIVTIILACCIYDGYYGISDYGDPYRVLRNESSNGETVYKRSYGADYYTDSQNGIATIANNVKITNDELDALGQLYIRRTNCLAKETRELLTGLKYLLLSIGILEICLGITFLFPKELKWKSKKKKKTSEQTDNTNGSVANNIAESIDMLFGNKE